jgi:hypothetical protein
MGAIFLSIIELNEVFKRKKSSIMDWEPFYLYYDIDKSELDARGIRVVDGGSIFIKMHKLSNGSRIYHYDTNLDVFPLLLIPKVQHEVFHEVFGIFTTDPFQNRWVPVNWDDDLSILERGETILRVLPANVPESIRESIRMKKSLTLRDLKGVPAERWVNPVQADVGQYT